MGVVMIGAVIKGDTNHDELIAHAIANIAAKLAIQFDKPVGLGITGPGMTDDQAVARIDNAKNAVEAVVRVAPIAKAGHLGEKSRAWPAIGLPTGC